MLKLDISQRPDFDPTSASDALAAGTQVDRYQLLEAVAEDDFGIVYRAFDTELDCQVAVKEHFPRHVAIRSDGRRVQPRDPEASAAFAAGVRTFAEDARALQPLHIRSVVRVLRVWLANGTAYRAMPWLEGQSLSERLADSIPIDALLDAVQVIHRRGHVHGRLSAERVFVTAASGIVLFGFRIRAPEAASIHVDDDANPCRPIELLRRSPLAPHVGLPGPWSDVYGLGALMHLMVSGRLPTLASERLLDDDYQPLGSAGVEGHEPHLLYGIDWALSVLPDRRPRDVAQFRRRLRADKPASSVRARSLGELVQGAPSSLHLRDLPPGAEPGQAPPAASTLVRQVPAQGSPKGIDFASTRPMVYGDTTGMPVPVPVPAPVPPVLAALETAVAGDGGKGIDVTPEAPGTVEHVRLDEAAFTTGLSTASQLEAAREVPVASTTSNVQATDARPEKKLESKTAVTPPIRRTKWKTGAAVMLALATLTGAAWWVLDPWIRPPFESQVLEMHPAGAVVSAPPPQAKLPPPGSTASSSVPAPVLQPPAPTPIAAAPTLALATV